MNDVKFFVPFTKSDNDQKIVEGYASSEALDSHGEIVSFEGIKKALPDYMKYANIREMHQWSAVGKTISAVPDEASKALYLVAKVVDEEAWKKCKEGVYTGFSIGGRIVKKVGNIIEQLELNEISLVDRPANPEAMFSVVKFAHDVQKSEGEMEDEVESNEEADGEWERMEGVRIARRIVETAEDLSYTASYMGAIGHSQTKDYLKVAIENLKMAGLVELALSLESVQAAYDQEEEEEMAKLNEINQEIKDFKDSLKYKKNWQSKYYNTLKKVN